jgi:hypothetical protein
VIDLERKDRQMAKILSPAEFARLSEKEQAQYLAEQHEAMMIKRGKRQARRKERREKNARMREMLKAQGLDPDDI